MKRQTPKAPTLKAIASAIGLSVRRTSELKRLGLPCHSTSAALEWYRARNGGSTAEELRSERIKLLKAQRERVETENKVRSGELISAAQAQESSARVCSHARNRLLMFVRDLPPVLEGLPAAGIAKALTKEINRVLTDLSEGYRDEGLAE